MIRSFTSLWLVAVLVLSAIPFMVSAQSQSFCTIDGYLSNQITSSSLDTLSEPGQHLNVSFFIQNDSDTYAYGGITVGVGLYSSPTATYPDYWAPVATDVQLLPQQRQLFESQIHAEFVPAGQYQVRIGAAQGGDLAALADSQENAGISLQKTVTEETYPFTLTQTGGQAAFGNKVSYQLVAENQTDAPLVGYEQHVVFVQGDRPLGSAVRHEHTAPVKMLSNRTEVSRTAHTITVPGNYNVVAFSTLTDVFLPLTVDTFTAGEGPGPSAVYIPGVGVDGLDPASDALTIVACPTPVSDPIADMSVLEHSASSNDQVTKAEYQLAAPEENTSISVVKTNEVTHLTTKLYRSAGPNLDPNLETDTDANDVNRGALLQSIEQKIVCDEECQPRSLSKTIESFAAEETVRNTFWFYLGIVLAAALLLLLMLRRLAPHEEVDLTSNEPK